MKNPNLVKRKVTYPGHLTDDQDRYLSELNNSDFMTVNITPRHIIFAYDATLWQWEKLLCELSRLELINEGFWTSKLNKFWYFVDKNIFNNSKLAAPACCNKAPVIPKKR